MPTKTWAPFERLLSTDMNTYLGAQVISTFASGAARNSAIPAPVVGQHAYLTDLKLLTFWDGSRWVSAQEYPVSIPNAIAVTVSSWQRGVRPIAIPDTTDFLYTRLDIAISAPNPHTASAYWNIQLYDEGSGAFYTAQNSWVIVPATTGFAFRQELPNVVGGQYVGDAHIAVYLTKVGAPGPLSGQFGLYGRLVT